MRGEREEVGENNGVRQDPFVPSLASSLSRSPSSIPREFRKREGDRARRALQAAAAAVPPSSPLLFTYTEEQIWGSRLIWRPLHAATFIAVDVQPRADHARRSHHGSSARIAARLVSHQGRRRRRRRRRLDGNVGRHEAKPLHARAASARPSRVVRPVDGYVTRAVLG